MAEATANEPDSNRRKSCEEREQRSIRECKEGKGTNFESQGRSPREKDGSWEIKEKIREERKDWRQRSSRGGKGDVPVAAGSKVHPETKRSTEWGKGER